jgi:lysophospholipase L1-like esterase
MKALLTICISVLVTLAMSVLLFELVSSYQYEQWHASFTESGDFYGNLTVASENETLLWEYRPNRAGEKWDTLIETNSAGFRDRDHDPEKAAGSVRIAFVGDSTTVGVGVEGDSIYARVFEQKAQELFPDLNVEALAFAVDGYNGLQALELIRARALAYAPDEVVYVMCMNDFDFYYSSGGKYDYFKKPTSFFLNMLKKAYLQLSDADYYTHHFQQNGAEVFAAIAATNSELADKGIRFKVVLLPIFYGKTLATPYPHGEMIETIFTSLTASGIDVVDLRAAFMSLGDGPQDYAGDRLHLSAAGHAVVADQLLSELLPATR